MHIYVKQEFASFQNSYFGYTDAKEQKYEIKDSSFLPWHKIEIKTDKYIEATIKQKYFGLKPNYMVFDHDERTGYELRRIGGIKTGKYSVVGKMWYVVGDFIGLNYAIVDQTGTQIASLSKRETPVGEALDVYAVAVEDMSLALAILFTVYLDQKDAVNKLKEQEKSENQPQKGLF